MKLGNPGGAVTRIAVDGKYTLMPGTRVVCTGLKNAAHLNGKIGDVHKFNLNKERRCEVRFEDKRLNNALVKLSNLRIVIDLLAEEGTGH
jgi:hypothetical protein